MEAYSNIRRIAIIGAGPAGVAAAKYLLAEKAFEQIDIFEQRANAGGVWNYTPENDSERDQVVPQTDPFASNEKAIWRKTKSNSGAQATVPTFISPIYETLEANLPKMLMQHKDADFAVDDPLFPHHEIVTEYLQDFALDITHLIKFGTQVDNLKRRTASGKTIWTVSYHNLLSGEQSSGEYEAVVVANGHYNVTYIPEFEGITEWNKQYPGAIAHSRFYRRPDAYKGKKVVVVGKGYSGLDISAQIAHECEPPLYWSTRDPAAQQKLPGRLNVHDIAEFLPPSSAQESRSIRLTDGTILGNIECLIFCTGYLYSYPFIAKDALDPPVITDGSRTRNVYKHIFYNADPTLAFIGLPQKVVVLPVTEGQAAVVAGVWSGRLKLPTQAEMEAWEYETVRKKGDHRQFHYLSPPEDGRYLNELFNLSRGAREFQDPDGDEVADHGGGGPRLDKEPPSWGKKDFWIRERILSMKQKFSSLNASEKLRVKTLEDLGFDYQEWLRQNREQNGATT